MTLCTKKSNVSSQTVTAWWLHHISPSLKLGWKPFCCWQGFTNNRHWAAAVLVSKTLSLLKLYCWASRLQVICRSYLAVLSVFCFIWPKKAAVFHCKLPGRFNVQVGEPTKLMKSMFRHEDYSLEGKLERRNTHTICNTELLSRISWSLLSINMNYHSYSCVFHHSYCNVWDLKTISALL